MPITMMCDKNAAGAELSAHWTHEAKREIYTKTEYVGQVLSLREYNAYHDSDFFAVVWDFDKGESISIEYGTTRFWSYPNTASVDATPEVLSAHKAYILNHAARYQIQLAHRIAQDDVAILKSTLLTHEQLNRLRGMCNAVIAYDNDNNGMWSTYSNNKFDALVKLLKSYTTHHLRSKFKISLCEQLLMWLKDVNPRWASPFSKKQWVAILPK